MRVALTTGRCRWCQCTEASGCPLGCHWMDDRMTLCSACADLDRLVRTEAGRKSLAHVCQEASEDGVLLPRDVR